MMIKAESINKYLESNRIIDWNNPRVMEKAKELSQGGIDQTSIAEKCFVFVRDKILHSNDHRLNPVTCKASDVLRYKTGFCYAKSHLLAALLRANGIPAGLCYQRLTIIDDRPPFCLHGLNGIYLPNCGWYRVDARGNNENIAADFCPPTEKLAFTVFIKGEMDFPEIWSQPLPEVVQLLESADTFVEVAENLPDMKFLNGKTS